MDQILPPELNDWEFEALRELAAHPATRRIPSRIQSRLKDIGYAKEVLGGIVLTKDGLQRGCGRQMRDTPVKPRTQMRPAREITLTSGYIRTRKLGPKDCCS